MLYMLGQRIIDQPNLTPKCLIKVGLSRDINKRIRNYKSDNPSATYISSTAGTEYEEKKCHSYLAARGRHYSGEWYEVNNSFFEECLKTGFQNFPKKKPDQPVYMHITYTPTDLTKQKIKKYYGVA